MPIISVEITKTRDEKETQPSSPPKKNPSKTNKQTNKDRKEQGGTEAIVNGWGLNDFVVHLS